MSTNMDTTPIDLRALRHTCGLNQQQFWGKVGVTQSGGSRYESGRHMPRPVRELVRLVHIEQLDIARIRHDDYLVLDYLRTEDPELFKTLKRSARDRARRRIAA